MKNNNIQQLKIIIHQHSQIDLRNLKIPEIKWVFTMKIDQSRQ